MRVEEVVWKNALIPSYLRIPTFTMQRFLRVICRRTRISDWTVGATLHIFWISEEGLHKQSIFILHQQGLKFSYFLFLIFHKRNHSFFGLSEPTPQVWYHFLGQQIHLTIEVTFFFLELVSQQSQSLFYVVKFLHKKWFVWGILVNNTAGRL